MIYYIDVPNDTDVMTQAKVEQVLCRVGPVTRYAVRLAELTPANVPLRQAGYRYEVAVTHDVAFWLVAKALVEEAGLATVIVGFDPHRTYSRITADNVLRACDQLESDGISLRKPN